MVAASGGTSPFSVMQMLWGRRVQRHPAHNFWRGSGRRNVQRLGALHVDTAWLSYVRHGMASVKVDETRQHHRAQTLLGRFKTEPFSDWFCDYQFERRGLTNSKRELR
jgi:hypothetical protein